MRFLLEKYIKLKRELSLIHNESHKRESENKSTKTLVGHNEHTFHHIPAT